MRCVRNKKVGNTSVMATSYYRYCLFVLIIIIITSNLFVLSGDGDGQARGVDA